MFPGISVEVAAKRCDVLTRAINVRQFFPVEFSIVLFLEWLWR